MSGKRKQAQPAVACPLDGGVRVPAGGTHRTCCVSGHCARRQTRPTSCSRGSARPKRGRRGRSRRRLRWPEACVGAALRRRAGVDGHLLGWKPANALPQLAIALLGQAATTMAAHDRFFDGPVSPLRRRPPLPDCPAQHGGAERPQRTDFQLQASRHCHERPALREAQRLRVWTFRLALLRNAQGT